MTPIIMPRQQMSVETSKSTSYIKVKSSRVIELAQMQLDWIAKKRAERLQKHLDVCRQRLTKTGRWYEWWQKYTPTDEEVRAYAYGETPDGTHKGDIAEWYITGGEIDFINNCYYNVEQISKQLLAVARDTEEVWVSAHDWLVINP